MTSPAAADRLAMLRDELEERYPGRWRALLLPLCGPDHRCSCPGKLPHVVGWQRLALARFERHNEPDARRWLATVERHVERGGNVGLALPPHVAALDADTDLEGGDDFDGPLAREGIAALCDDHPTQESGKLSGGRRVGVHVLGGTVEPRASGTHYGRVPVTLRHVGNQIVVAPSRHTSGARYRWLRGLPDDPALLPDFDPTLFRHVSSRRGAIERRVDESGAEWRQRVARAWRARLEDPEERFAPGERHEALLWAGWNLTAKGAPTAAVQAALEDLAATRCAGEGRFAAAPGSPEAHALERELAGIAASCRRRWEAWASRR